MSGPSSDAAVRSLWINGLSSEVSVDALQARLRKMTSGAGTFTVRRMSGSSGAWVDFTSPSFAQEAVLVLNGSTVGTTSVLARYARLGELTTSAPGACRNLWLSSASKAAPSTPPAAAAAVSAASGADRGTDAVATGGATAASSAANGSGHQSSSSAQQQQPPPPPPPPPQRRQPAEGMRRRAAAEAATSARATCRCRTSASTTSPSWAALSAGAS